MPVTHFITHQITKAGPQDGAQVSLNGTLSTVDDYANKVMSQLRSIFISRAGKRYGRFNPDAPQIKALTLDWLNDKQSFLSFTQTLAKYFASHLDNSPLEIDGYIAVIAEEIADGERLYVYHLREKTNVAFNNNMELTETKIIDFSNTGFALCINTGVLKGDDQEKYLSYSYGRGEKALQNSFSEFIGFTDTINVEQETQEFLQIVNEYTKSLSDADANETRTKVVEYCMEQDKYGAPVEFKAISQEIDEHEPEKFEKFIVEKREQARSNSAAGVGAENSETALAEVRNEFIPDRKSLKNYVRFSGKNKDVTLSFSAAALGGDVQFNAGNNTLVIANLPARLLKQLQQDKDFSDSQ
ncbi:MAG: nucleoid-associated protein [Bermanella sp.]|jgi:nucleoid-associated protein